MDRLEEQLQGSFEGLERCFTAREELHSRLLDLERQIGEADRSIDIERAHQSRAIDQHLERQAKALEERSEAYHSTQPDPQLLDEALMDNDQKVIAVYKDNFDVPAIVSSLESAYQEAKDRETLREEFGKSVQNFGDNPITAGVLLHYVDDRLDIYVTKLQEQEEKGLLQNLVASVAESILVTGVDAELDENSSLVKFRVGNDGNEPDYSNLVSVLNEKLPEGFEEASVQYRVLEVHTDSYKVNGTAVVPTNGEKNEAEVAAVSEEPVGELLTIGPPLEEQPKISLKVPEQLEVVPIVPVETPLEERVVVEEETVVEVQETLDVSNESDPKSLFGDMYDTYAQTYGEERLDKITEKLRPIFSENGLNKVRGLCEVIQDYKPLEQLINMASKGNIQRYVNGLTSTLSLVAEIYSDGSVPERYDITVCPANFLPGYHSKIKRELRAKKKELIQKGNVGGAEEVSKKLGYDIELVRGLMDEGHNVIYLDAIVRKGLKHECADPYSGRNKQSMEKGIMRYLQDSGTNFRKRDLVREFSRLSEVLGCRTKGGRGRRNKRKLVHLDRMWQTNTTGFLNQYLTNLFGE